MRKGRTAGTLSGRASFRLGLIASLLGVSLAFAAAQGGKGDSWLHYGQRALEEYRAKNYPAFLENVERAARVGPPRHPWLMYQLARAYSLNGKTDEASKLLGELADMRIGVDAAGHPDFSPLRGAAGWVELSKKIGTARAPVVRSRTAFVIPEPDLLPEGIAYDPRRRTFYLGSVYKAKIIALDRVGRRRDFKASGQDGLSSVLGMKVDARRRLLWVCSNTRDGAASVHKYALDSGELIKKYTLDERPARRQFNDIALSRRGDAYVTDSLGAAVYEIPARADELRPLVRFEPGVYPNGVALSGDERRLYVATAAGISLVDIGAKAVNDLARGAGVATAGVDGLYLYRGSLVAVQNANPSPDRVVRLFLSADGGKAERARVLESNHPDYALPTTGVAVGDELFYVANTQIDRVGAGGQLQPGAQLRDLILLRLKLN
jgi:hypothetical protein